MSLTADDVVRLPWEDRYTLAGALHACRSLPGWGRSRPRPSLPDLRQRGAQAGAELALRAWLEGQGIPYHLAPTAGLRPGSLPRLVLWGHRLWLHLALVGRAPELPEDVAARLLAGQAEVPDTLLDSAGAMPEDLFVFACLVAEITRRRPHLRRLAAQGQPVFLVALPPTAWRRPPRQAAPWQVRNDSRFPLHLEMGIETAGRRPRVEQVHLPACAQVCLPARAEGLRYLHTRRLPGAALVLRRAGTPEWVVSPGRWHDLWLRDPALLLLGWITRREFRRRARRATDGRARWAMPCSLLQPVGRLLSARQI